MRLIYLYVIHTALFKENYSNKLNNIFPDFDNNDPKTEKHKFLSNPRFILRWHTYILLTLIEEPSIKINPKVNNENSLTTAY